MVKKDGSQKCGKPSENRNNVWFLNGCSFELVRFSRHVSKTDHSTSDVFRCSLYKSNKINIKNLQQLNNLFTILSTIATTQCSSITPIFKADLNRFCSSFPSSRLPMDPQTGKMILLGAIFSCLVRNLM
jgi:hypothetical protein